MDGSAAATARTLFLVSILAFFSTKNGAQGYSSGAPPTENVCTTQTPGHGYSPQANESPFSIVPKYRNYGPSVALEVNLTAGSGHSFKGFIVQARIQHTTYPIGIFSNPSDQGQTLDCQTGFTVANTVTHKNNAPKTELVLVWTAPNDIEGANIEFVGTFVEQYTTFWTEVKSVVLTDACHPSPCHNGATCYRASTEGYQCMCATGFTGRHCDEIVQVCAEGSCGARGVNCLLSVDNPNSFVCECLNGDYLVDQACPDQPMTTTTLPDTTTPTVHPCEVDPSPCQNGGICILNSGDHIQCFCTGGYTGTYCEISPTVPACSSGPCMNGGGCSTRADGSFVCQCVGIYTGPQCQYEVGCASIPCLNGGSCTSVGSYARDYICACGEMYTGSNCESEIITDPCMPQPCQNGGYCSRRGDVTGSGFACTCFGGFSGTLCETPPPSPTTPRPTTPPPSTTSPPITTESVVQCEQNCQNGGTCTNGVCVCLPGYGGFLCEQDYRPRFVNCPEGETLVYDLSQNSNMAVIDLDPITATNYRGATLLVEFLVGPNINARTSLQFSEAFAAGQEVVARAVDDQGRMQYCNFTIRLEDRERPSITCPADVAITTTSPSVRVSWEDAEVRDNADPSPVVTYSPHQSGSMFKATGESVSIIARATDSSSNYQECLFQVTVYPRVYDCEAFPELSNAEVTCQVSAQSRQCRVSCGSGFINTVGSSRVYTCVADSAGAFWDPLPTPDVCARAMVGNGITKTVGMTFPLSSSLCPEDNDSFGSAIERNISSILESNSLCQIGSASACGPDSITSDCFNSARRRRRSSSGTRHQGHARHRRQSGALFVEIDVYSPTSAASDQSEIERDVDALADGIGVVADSGGFELTVNGELLQNNPSSTQVDSEFRWSCGAGQISTSSGCASCPRGTYYDASTNTCTFCSLGTYQDQQGQTSCDQCPSGHLTDATGSTSSDDCVDRNGALISLTQTQWILVYIACGVAGVAIITLFISLLVCCCRHSDDSSSRAKQKSKEAADNLMYLNRAFEDDSIGDQMTYNGSLGRNGTLANGNGTLPSNGRSANGHIPRGSDDARLIEIPSDPDFLYAEVPVTTFGRNSELDARRKTNGHANGHVSSVSAAVDMADMPSPPSMGAPPPPPPPPPSDQKSSRIAVESSSYLPPAPMGHRFGIDMPGDSMPLAQPPPPPTITGSPAPAPPPPPPPPVVASANNSYPSSPSGSTASNISGRRTQFRI